MSSKTLAELREEARKRGVSLSEVVKEVVLEKKPVNRLDVER